MSILMVNESADFNMLKELLGVTDGNLASHTKALESENYIMIEKQFIGKKPNTRYIATKDGKKAFKEHIEALEKLIQKSWPKKICLFTLKHKVLLKIKTWKIY